MNTFLKVLLILIAAVLLVKLLPLAFGLAVFLGVVIAIAAIVGLGAAGVVICVALGLVILLSPVWLPVLAVVGLIALWKKLSNKTA